MKWRKKMNQKELKKENELKVWKIRDGKVMKKAEEPIGMKKTVKICFGVYAVMIIALCVGIPVFAAATDPLTVVNNLSNFIFALIRAIGLILLGWGIVQVGMSLQSHDPSQRTNGFLTLAGGIVITFAQEILNLITGVQ